MASTKKNITAVQTISVFLVWFFHIHRNGTTGVWNKTNIHLKAVFRQDDIYSGRSMSHVLGLHSHTPGKYELKYKLTTLIYPFTKQRTSSWAQSSGEIAWLLFFPTEPEGANWGWDGTLVGWLWPSRLYANTCTYTHKHCLLSEVVLVWINSSFMSAPVSWRQDQRVIRWESSRVPRDPWGYGWRGPYTARELGDLWEVICVTASGLRWGKVWRIFWFRLLDIVCVNGEQKEEKW